MARSPYDVLIQTDRVVDLRNRHRDYHLRLAETAEPELRGPDQVAWIDVVEAELDNIRAALEWSFAKGHTDEALRIATSLERLWLRHPREGRVWLERAADASRDPSALRARALSCASEHEMADWPATVALVDEALTVARAVGNDVEIARALNRTSYVQSFVRDAVARQSVGRGGAAARPPRRDRHLTARALNHLGFAVWLMEGPESSQPIFEEGTSIDRELGDKAGVARGLYQLVIGAPPGPQRRAYQDEAVRIQRELRDDIGLTWTLDAIAYASLFTDGPPVARAAWDEALALVRSMAAPQSLDYFLTVAGMAACFAGDMRAGRGLTEEALAMKGLSYGLALQQLVHVVLAEGDVRRALEIVRDARAHNAPEFGTSAAIAAALRASGDDEAARVAFQEALDASERRGGSEGQGITARSLAVLAMRTGDFELARSALESAKDPSGRAGVTTRAFAELALREGDVDRAAELHRTALRETVDGFERPAVPWSFEGIADVAIARGRHANAARLLGAAERLRENVGCAREAWWIRGDTDYLARDDDERREESLREVLGDAFAAAWDEGRAMTEDAAVAFALRTT